MVDEKKQAVNGEGTGEAEKSAAAETDAEEVEVEATTLAQEEVDERQEATTDQVAGLLQDIERLKMEVQESSDKAVRATAELDNIRKRTSRDIENAHKYALERFVSELLPVLDSMELGINASQSAEDIESLREGMDLTLKMLFDRMGKFGVKTIDPAGEKFDPEWHEAVSMQELEGSEPGQVVTVMQKGYELNGRLVRPAMVVVAK
ncbi:MAG: nucleotide exchange factor GrpE [Gammaproteobacteria bacterium]|nr:nucleotide exchange factor GrpE [Gammaproteobacteria bacterium]